MGLRAFGLVVALFAFVTLATREAGACSCLSYADAGEYLPYADVAFEGLLERVEQRGHRLENVFQVDRVWKGVVGRQMSIDTAGGVCRPIAESDSCGLVLTPGERYLVFANFGYSTCRPTADLCSGTRLSSEATDAFAQLGPGTPPQDGGTEPPAPCNDTPCPDAGVVGGSGGSGGMPQIPADATASGGTASIDASSAASSGLGDPSLEPTRETASSGCTCSAPASRGARSSALLLLVVAGASLLGRRSQTLRVLLCSRS